MLRGWNISREIAPGGARKQHFIVRDFVVQSWYNKFISANDDFPKAAAVVMVNAVGKFSNRVRLCATTEYKRLWLMDDGVIKILSKKFNWYRTLRNNAEETHTEVRTCVRACIARRLRSGVGWKRVPPKIGIILRAASIAPQFVPSRNVIALLTCPPIACLHARSCSKISAA